MSPDMQNGKRILVLGGGGREHAIVRAIAQSPLVSHVFAAPGNAGIALEPKCGTFSRVAADDIDAVLALAWQQHIGFIIPGSETPLVAGIADAVANDGPLARWCRVFGPNARASMITEGSKCDAKAFMARHEIPTAPFECFSNMESARPFILGHNLPMVVKADGLAGGKGVRVCETSDEAVAFAEIQLRKHGRIVVEEFLAGEELTFTCMVVNGEVLPLAESQDRKMFNGKMTGGVGAYSPVPFADAALRERIMRQIVYPTVSGLKGEGVRYTGFLYFGLMIVNGEPFLLEYNCRLGDPEAQVILPRFRGNFLELITDALNGRLPSPKAIASLWDKRAAVSVVLMDRDYPNEPPDGYPSYQIQGLEIACKMPGIQIFHANTAIAKSRVTTNGGRVLGLTALGVTLEEAVKRVYAAAEKIQWPGMQYCPDIGRVSPAVIAP